MVREFAIAAFVSLIVVGWLMLQLHASTLHTYEPHLKHATWDERTKTYRVVPRRAREVRTDWTSSKP